MIINITNDDDGDVCEGQFKQIKVHGDTLNIPIAANYFHPSK